MHDSGLTRRYFLTALSAAVCALPVACGRRGADAVERQVTAALARLRERDETALPGEDGLPGGILRPHVRFEEATTKKFVQFTGSRNEALQLDLATSSLNVEERERAKAFFGGLGVRRRALHDDEFVYNVHLGGDTKRAAQLTLRVFREIYRLPDGFRLRIDEQ